jgi:hypothetical protein
MGGKKVRAQRNDLCSPHGVASPFHGMQKGTSGMTTSTYPASFKLIKRPLWATTYMLCLVNSVLPWTAVRAEELQQRTEPMRGPLADV